MALTVFCSQKHVHIPKSVKRYEAQIRNKVTRIAKVCDQIAREDIAYIKKKIPKIQFENEEDVMQVEPIIVEVDKDIFDSE